MAEHNALSLHTQVNVKLHPSWEAGPVDIIATSPDELFHTVHALVAGIEQGNAAAGTQTVAPATQPAPQAPQATPAATTQPQPTQPAPQPQPAAQPAPSVAAPAPQASATPSAPATTEQPSLPEVGLPDVLTVARQLLQRPDGEDRLKEILAQHGASAVSSAPAEAYPAIKAGIEQILGQQ